MLRQRFKHVRFIVPNIAKRAATMMAMSGDEIWMDANAELGPVDPQLVFRKGDGSMVQAPAQAIVDQFDDGQKAIGADPKRLPAWMPILPQYEPGGGTRIPKLCSSRVLRSDPHVQRRCIQAVREQSWRQLL